MALEVTKFINDGEMFSLIFDEDEVAFIIDNAEIIYFDGTNVGLDAEIEISKKGFLAIEIDFDSKNGIYFYKEFHCTEHAVEFCHRNLSKNVRIGYLIHAIKWDQINFWGESKN